MILHYSSSRTIDSVDAQQAVLKVPGMYGPSKEEWEAFGRPAPM